MSGHKSWNDLKSNWFRDSPEARASYDEAKRRLDATWQIECRYGNCVIFVSPDSSVGPDQDDGWGPIDCPCKANDDGYCMNQHEERIDPDQYGEERHR